MGYLLFVGLLRFLSAVPKRMAFAVAERIAAVIHYLDKKHQQIGLINLAVAFPERDDAWRKSVLRSSFLQLGRHAVEIARLSRMQPADFSDFVRYDDRFGLSNYHEAKKDGAGVIFMAAHVSAWEVLPSAHAVFTHPLNIVVRPLDNPYLDQWAGRVRTRFANKVVSKFGSIRTLLRLLAGGEDIGILIDQNVQEKDGVFAPLFSRPAATSAAIAALSLKTSAPIIPAFLVPDNEKGKYVIRFYPAFRAEKVGSHQENLVHTTTLLNSYLETVLREFPDCWLWSHKRFRTQPDGSDIYAGIS